MKNLIALTILFLSLNSFGSVAFTVEGELLVNTGEDQELFQMILVSEGKKVKIANFDHQAISKCKIGLFEVVNNFYPEGTYSLLDVYGCYQDQEDNDQVCEEIYRPVCGVPKRIQCISDFCIEMMPVPKTYENYCVLHNSGASFSSMGECGEASYL